MRVLGISGKYRDAAAAIAVDGHVIAAASEDAFTRMPGVGYTQTGGFPRRAVEACLHKAGLRSTDVEQVTVVHGERRGRPEDDAGIGQVLHGIPLCPIDAMQADAVQTAASGPRSGSVLVWSTDPPSAAVFGGDDRLAAGKALGGAEALAAGAASLARVLGLSSLDPFGALDRLGVGGDPAFERDLASAMGADAGGVMVNLERLNGTAGSVARGLPGALSDATSLNERVQRVRRALAASFTCRTEI